MFNYVITQEAITYVWIKNVSIYMCWCMVENIINFLIHTNVLIHRNVTQMCYFYESVCLWNIILMCVYLCKCIEQDLTVPCWCGFPHALKASILTLASGGLTKQMVLDTFRQQGWCTVLQRPQGDKRTTGPSCPEDIPVAWVTLPQWPLLLLHILCLRELLWYFKNYKCVQVIGHELQRRTKGRLLLWLL